MEIFIKHKGKRKAIKASLYGIATDSQTKREISFPLTGIKTRHRNRKECGIVGVLPFKREKNCIPVQTATFIPALNTNHINGYRKFP